MNSKLSKDFFPIGKILKPKGLKGEVKVFLYNINSDILDKNIIFWIKKNGLLLEYSVEFFKNNNKYCTVKFKNIIDRNCAQDICGKRIYICRKDLPDKKGTYLIDLIGFLVIDRFNMNYGKVIDIIHLPTNDSLLIDYNGREIMIPIIDDFIELFDYEDEVVIVKNSDVFIKEC